VRTFLNDSRVSLIKTLWSMKVPVGHFVICHNCDADDIVLTKESARKFYSKHGGMHRHPSATYTVVV
jgi:hypothetical protein